jgi:hypothetical protein
VLRFNIRRCPSVLFIGPDTSKTMGKIPIGAVKSIHMPFVTPVAQKYLHLSNSPNLDYSPNE